MGRPSGVVAAGKADADGGGDVNVQNARTRVAAATSITGVTHSLGAS